MIARAHILLVGPMPIDGDVVGGTKVSFAHLVESLSGRDRFQVEVVNTSRAQRGHGRIRRAWNNASQLLRLVGRLVSTPAPDLVFFNTSSGGALLSAPLVWWLCRLRRRPLVVRVFGGDLDLFFERASAPLRWLAGRTFLRSSRVLLQTRSLCEVFSSKGNVQWWPTTRDMAPRRTPRSSAAKRFLFLGQLRREKGICEALEAAKSLPAGTTLSVYGPAMSGFDATEALEQSNCDYGGPLTPEQVPEVLANHDVLVFPSFHAGEGMPGILIEAMQLGLPILCSRWRALGELVEHEVNGLLSAPQDATELASAMSRLARDPELFAQLCEGAERRGDRFRSAPWCDWLEQELMRLCGAPTPEETLYREVA